MGNNNLVTEKFPADKMQEASASCNVQKGRGDPNLDLDPDPDPVLNSAMMSSTPALISLSEESTSIKSSHEQNQISVLLESFEAFASRHDGEGESIMQDSECLVTTKVTAGEGNKEKEIPNISAMGEFLSHNNNKVRNRKFSSCRSSSSSDSTAQTPDKVRDRSPIRGSSQKKSIFENNNQDKEMSLSI